MYITLSLYHVISCHITVSARFGARIFTVQKPLLSQQESFDIAKPAKRGGYEKVYQRAFEAKGLAKATLDAGYGAPQRFALFSSACRARKESTSSRPYARPTFLE